MISIFYISENNKYKQRLDDFFMNRGDSITACNYSSFQLSELLMKVPDLLIFDMTELTKEGNSLCKQIKAEHKIPIISITEHHLLSGLDFTSGFDDFILLNYDDKELAGRVSILMWKYKKIANNDIITVQGLEINIANYSASIDGEPIELTFKEFELLKFMATHQGRAYTRDILLNQVWSFEYYGGTRTVDVHIRRLRFKLGKYEHLVQTVRNVGYKFGH